MDSGYLVAGDINSLNLLVENDFRISKYIGMNFDVLRYGIKMCF